MKEMYISFLMAILITLYPYAYLITAVYKEINSEMNNHKIEIEGNREDRSYAAPKTINSKNITSFECNYSGMKLDDKGSPYNHFKNITIKAVSYQFRLWKPSISCF